MTCTCLCHFSEPRAQDWACAEPLFFTRGLGHAWELAGNKPKPLGLHLPTMTIQRSACSHLEEYPRSTQACSLGTYCSFDGCWLNPGVWFVCFLLCICSADNLDGSRGTGDQHVHHEPLPREPQLRVTSSALCLCSWPCPLPPWKSRSGCTGTNVIEKTLQ